MIQSSVLRAPMAIAAAVIVVSQPAVALAQGARGGVVGLQLLETVSNLLGSSDDQTSPPPDTTGAATVPELSASGAGTAGALLLGLTLLVADRRRRRRAPTQA